MHTLWVGDVHLLGVAVVERGARGQQGGWVVVELGVKGGHGKAVELAREGGVGSARG